MTYSDRLMNVCMYAGALQPFPCWLSLCLFWPTLTLPLPLPLLWQASQFWALLLILAGTTILSRWRTRIAQFPYLPAGVADTSA